MTKLPEKFVEFISDLGENALAIFHEADDGDWIKFQAQLSALFKLSANLEALGINSILKGFQELSETACCEWFISQLEMESGLRFLNDSNKKEKSCLLFLIPVTVRSGDSLSRDVENYEAFENLHLVLTEAEVINASAKFKLVPKLFSYDELFLKSYGEIYELTNHLAEQVLSSATNLTLPENFSKSQAPASGATEYADVYYLVGCATISNYELDEIFPTLADEAENSNASDSSEAPELSVEVQASGFMEDGTSWEDAFCDNFNDCFSVMFGAMSTLPPDGFFEDLRRGKSLSRELALILSSEEIDEPILVRISPVFEPDGQNAYLEIGWVSSDTKELLNSFVWPIFEFESVESAIDDLLLALSDLEIVPEDPSYLASTSVGGFLLH